MSRFSHGQRRHLKNPSACRLEFGRVSCDSRLPLRDRRRGNRRRADEARSGPPSLLSPPSAPLAECRSIAVSDARAPSRKRGVPGCLSLHSQ